MHPCVPPTEKDRRRSRPRPSPSHRERPPGACFWNYADIRTEFEFEVIAGTGGKGGINYAHFAGVLFRTAEYGYTTQTMYTSLNTSLIL